MTSSSRPSPSERLHQAPPPAAPRGGLPYTRFIPREELQGFAAWQPDAFAEMPAFLQPAQPGSPHAAVRAHRGGPLNDGPPPPVWPAPGFSDGASAAAPDLGTPVPAPAPVAADTPTLEELHAEMQAEMQTQVAAARQQGYQDGYRDGLVALESFKESFASQTSAQMAQVLKSLDDELGQLEQQLAASVARVATELARQVVRSELSMRPALVVQVAREAVNAVLMSARHITVQVHPDDHVLVSQGCEEALLARGARLLAQPGLSRGGCRVESDAGVIDARVATRWAQATQALGTGVAWDDREAAQPADGGDA
jgi:flagellar assembly protein FliH